MIDIPYLKKFIPECVENDDLYLSCLYISASAKIDNIVVPDELVVDFDEDNPSLGKLVSIEPSYFFSRATNLFLDRKRAEDALHSLKEKVSVIGISILAVKKSIEKSTLAESGGYDLYKEIMIEYRVGENAFSESVYMELRDAMIYLPLKKDSRIIYGNKYPDSSSGCIRLAKLLKNKLHLSYMQQVVFVYSVSEAFTKTKLLKNYKNYTSEQVRTIRKDVWPKLGFFSNYGESPAYIKKVEESIILMHSIGHFLAVLQTLEIYNRSSSNEKKAKDKSSDDAKLPTNAGYDSEKLSLSTNNISIECSLIIDSVKAALLCNNLEKRKAVFIEPSFTLIDRWYRDSELDSFSVFFVILKSGQFRAIEA